MSFTVSPLSLFSLPADKIAYRLLGSHLVRRFADGQVKPYLITEVEAYVGEKDKACHAHKGRTARTEVMYGPAGYWYVYLIYGMYYMLNLVTAQINQPHAVLFRGLVDLETGKEIDGPGKLTKELAVDKSFNALPANIDTGLWIKLNDVFDDNQIERLPRVGVDYAQEWADKPLRFRLKR